MFVPFAYNIRTNQFLRFDVVVYVEQVGPPALVTPFHFLAHFLVPQRSRSDLDEHRAVERDHHCVDRRQSVTEGRWESRLVIGQHNDYVTRCGQTLVRVLCLWQRIIFF